MAVKKQLTNYEKYRKEYNLIWNALIALDIEYLSNADANFIYEHFDINDSEDVSKLFDMFVKKRFLFDQINIIQEELVALNKMIELDDDFEDLFKRMAFPDNPKDKRKFMKLANKILNGYLEEKIKSN